MNYLFMKQSVVERKTQSALPKSSKTRYGVLDLLRGIAVINMIAYHTLWDIVYIFGVNLPWFRSNGAYVWQQFICWTFILISGFCYSFSSKKGKAKRGGVVFAMGLAVSLCTLAVMPEDCVIFGILTLIGSCMLILLPAEKLFQRLEPVTGFALSAVLFFLLRNVNRGYIGFEGLNFFRLPDALYRNYLTAYLGFPPSTFSSSDYFSLVPWIFLFAAGRFLNGIFEKFKLTGCLTAVKAKPIEWIGRHSLTVYIVHQPVIYGVCLLVFSLIRT